jgi:hypothetical protein
MSNLTRYSFPEPIFPWVPNPKILFAKRGANELIIEEPQRIGKIERFLQESKRRKRDEKTAGHFPG